MKLLNEASLDDQFNVQMDKIQQAIIKLEKIADAFRRDALAPVQSQQRALNTAAYDLEKIEALMFKQPRA